MVIEYAGELIRSTLTDQRERYYDSKGIGCYMFKIDDNLVVDATMSGTAARFINHSCDVNISTLKAELLFNYFLFILAKLLLESGGYFGGETHHHFLSASYCGGRRADLRLQVPIRGRKDSLLLRHQTVSQVFELRCQRGMV